MRIIRYLSLTVLIGLLIGIGVSPAHADTWWVPTPGSTLHWNLGGAINVDNPKHVGERELGTNAVLPRPDALDIDGEFNSAATVATLHSRGQRVICYVDAGVYEDYRSDAWKFPPEVIGRPDGNWEGSWWLDIRRLDILLPIMEARVRDWCQAKGFDGVEFDEVDGWENTTGFPITYDDQLRYNRALADLAHAYNLAAIQKGDIIQSQDLVSWTRPDGTVTGFDAVLNEQCAEFRECTNPWRQDVNPDVQVPGLQVYSNAGKAVWGAEYRASHCTRARTLYLNKYPTWRFYQFREGLPLSGGRKIC